MTREEAIKGLKVLAKDFRGYKPNEEMFDMAIEALEQETAPFDFELYQAGLMEMPKEMIKVLDAIRAEIVERQKDYHEYGWAYDDALEIIDEYREEYAEAPSKDLTPDPSAEIEEDGFITWFFNRSES